MHVWRFPAYLVPHLSHQQDECAFYVFRTLALAERGRWIHNGYVAPLVWFTCTTVEEFSAYMRLLFVNEFLGDGGVVVRIPHAHVQHEIQPMTLDEAAQRRVEDVDLGIQAELHRLFNNHAIVRHRVFLR